MEFKVESIGVLRKPYADTKEYFQVYTDITDKEELKKELVSHGYSIKTEEMADWFEAYLQSIDKNDKGWELTYVYPFLD